MTRAGSRTPNASTSRCTPRSLARPTPALDRAMSRLSRAADYSRLSLASAALLALAGGRPGRRAAAMGLASLAVTATVVNVAVKPLGTAATSRPPRAGRAARAPRADAGLALVPVRAHRGGVRVRDRRRPRVAGGGRPAARARRARRLLARPHRRALPRRRARRRADRHHARAAHDARCATGRLDDAIVERLASAQRPSDPVDRASRRIVRRRVGIARTDEMPHDLMPSGRWRASHCASDALPRREREGDTMSR